MIGTGKEGNLCEKFHYLADFFHGLMDMGVAHLWIWIWIQIIFFGGDVQIGGFFSLFSFQFLRLISYPSLEGWSSSARPLCVKLCAEEDHPSNHSPGHLFSTFASPYNAMCLMADQFPYIILRWPFTAGTLVVNCRFFSFFYRNAVGHNNQIKLKKVRGAEEGPLEDWN